MRGVLWAAAAMLLATTAAPVVAQAISTDGSTVTVADPSTQTQFDVFLPLQNEAGLDQLLKALHDPASPSYHQWLTADQFDARFGPSADAIASVKAAAIAAGFTFVEQNGRALTFSGSVAQVNSTFGTSLNKKVATTGAIRLVQTSTLTLPSAFVSAGAFVATYMDVPDRKPLSTLASVASVPDNRTSSTGGYWYNDMKQAYDYPAYTSKLPSGAKLDGTGVGVAVLMSDLVQTSDVAGFFNHENFKTNAGVTATPTFTTVKRNGGGTQGGNGSVEATLDVEQVLGGAPGSSVALISIPSLANSYILSAYQYIVTQNKWALVNSSFGGCEAAYTAAYNGGTDYTYLLKQFDTVFKQGNAMGITFVASSGDEGGLECPDSAYFYGHDRAPKFVPSVSDPADSPNVTSVGGTNLVTKVTANSLDSTYDSENGYGDPEIAQQPYGYMYGALKNGYWGAGGGISQVYAQPDYQKLVNTGSTSRTLPDVGMQVGGCPGGISVLPCGKPRSYVITWYGGKAIGLIGTSVASPEFVGALALFVQASGRQGNVNTYLYQKGAEQTAAGGINAPAEKQFYHRNIPGFDGAWDASYPSYNYNYIVGNGTPDVRKLFGFTQYAPAGVPQTASNP